MKELFENVQNFILFKEWFFVFCIIELTIYLISAIYVICKLKEILTLRNYLIILVFGLSLTAEIILIPYVKKNMTSLEEVASKVSNTDQEDDSKLVIDTVL